MKIGSLPIPQPAQLQQLYDAARTRGPGEAGAMNAGVLAASILAGEDPELLKRLDAWRKKQTDSVSESVEDGQ